ncbi:MAG: hypothetical protein WC461_00225 [Candidatus Paceibacterota bacterium]
MYVAVFEGNFGVADELVWVIDEFKKFIITVFADEMICKIYKVLSSRSHFLSPFRDFPPPELDRYTETFGILRYKPEIGLLTAQQAFGFVDVGNIAQIYVFVN